MCRSDAMPSLHFHIIHYSNLILLDGQSKINQFQHIPANQLIPCVDGELVFVKPTESMGCMECVIEHIILL